MNSDGEQFLFDRPSEHSLDAADSLVDALSGQPLADDLAIPSHFAGLLVDNLYLAC